MQEEGVFLAINLPDLGNEFTVKCKIMLSSLSDFKDSSWALLEILWPPFRKRSMGIGNLADKLDIYHSDNVFSKMSDHEQEIFVFYLSTYFWIFCLFFGGGRSHLVVLRAYTWLCNQITTARDEDNISDTGHCTQVVALQAKWLTYELLLCPFFLDLMENIAYVPDSLKDMYLDSPQVDSIIVS